jgi:hypothetical protein
MVDRTQEESLQIYDVLPFDLQNMRKTLNQTFNWLIVVNLVGDDSTNAQNPTNILGRKFSLREVQKLEHQAHRKIN